MTATLHGLSFTKRALLCCCAILIAPSPVLAQEAESRASITWSVTKSVIFDPTTYTPATLSYYSQRQDWVTSEVLFRAGWLEANPRFTSSGLPKDVPVSYSEANATIRKDALGYLAQSVLNNAGANIVERSLVARYPEHRRLFQTLSWIERVSAASYLSYLASIDHFQQAERNRAMATEHGLK